jgi:hypothetical protein
LLMSLVLMKMGVLGIEKAGKTWAKMDTDVGGQGWVVNRMMVPPSGKKRYKYRSIM